MKSINRSGHSSLKVMRHAVGSLTLAAFVGVQASLVGATTIINVPEDYDTIQAAIDAASDGDRIEVDDSGGPYKEAIVIDGKNITVVATPDRVKIDATGKNTSAVTIQDAGSDAAVEFIGFNITGGTGQEVDTERFDDLSEGKTYGGGMLTKDSVVDVLKCKFKENTVTGGGAGMANLSSDVIVKDSLFIKNDADEWGGGMANYRSVVDVKGDISVDANGLLDSSTTVFQRNSGGEFSGGIDNYNSRLTLSGIAFRENKALTKNGGGVWSGLGSGQKATLAVTECLFEGNVADQTGGGVADWGNDTATVKNSRFVDNEAKTGRGGGMFAGDGTTITDSRFESNVTGDEGGGIGHQNGKKPEVGDSFFCGNTPDHIEKPWTDLGGNEFQDSCGSGDSGGDNAPNVDSLSLDEARSGSPHAEFQSSWAVSDSDGDLDTVELTLTDLDDGETEDAATVDVSGDSASDTTNLTAKHEENSGNEYEVEFVVTDGNGNTDVGTATEIEDGS